MPVKKPEIRNKKIPYTTIPNKSIKSLSPEALGLLNKMVYRPDDWIFHTSRLCIECGWGIKKLRKYFRELKKKGFLSFSILQDEKTGLITGKTYFVCAESEMTLEDYEYNHEYPKGTDGQSHSESTNQEGQNGVAGGAKTGSQGGSKQTLLLKKDTTKERDSKEGESSPSPSAALEEDEFIEEVPASEHFSGKNYVNDEEKATTLYPSLSDEYVLASALWNFLNKSNPQHIESYKHKQEYTLQQWADEFHKMLVIDNLTLMEILFVIRWSQESKFWVHKYFSASGFRKKYSDIVLDMNSKGCYFEMSNSPDKEVTNQMISMWGEEILGQSSYHPRVHDLAKFVDATKKLLEFETERGKERGRDKFEILVILFDCLKYYYKEKGDGILYVGHLCSDNTWGNLMPQFFTEHY